MISKRLHPASFSNVNAQLAQKPNEISGLDGTIDLTGGQIKFPVTQSASSDPNTLDDYEEGSWTPTAFGATTAGVGTYSIQSGQYTKIGNLVHIEIVLSWSAHTGTGSLRIGGLPFATTGIRQSFSIAVEGLNYSGQLTCLNNAGQTNISLYSQTSGGSLTDVAMGTSVGYLVITGDYAN